MRWLWSLIKVIGLFIFLGGILLVAGHLARTYYAEAKNWQQIFYRTHHYWLAWRTLLYLALGYGLWALYSYSAIKITKQAHQSLKRITLVAAFFIIVSELTLWFSRETGL